MDVTSVPDVTTLWHAMNRPAWTSLHPSTRTYGDRFIPNRAATNMDLAQGLLTIPKRESTEIISPSREAYLKLLADVLFQGRTRILCFRDPPRTAVQSLLDPPCLTQVQPARQHRYVPQWPKLESAFPGIIDDDCLNLLDWGSSKLLATGLGDSVYLWNFNKMFPSELVTVEDDYGPVTSVSWAPDGNRIAIGLSNSDVQLWDATSNKRIRTLSGMHQERVGSLAWKNNHLLTTGGGDGAIINNDVRIRSHAVSAYRHHDEEICGLKWSSSGKHLASGANDKLLHIWDLSKPTPLHQFKEHTGAVRALAWCPFKDNLLVSGGGKSDNCIKFWNVSSGTCLNSVDTKSQVCSLLWNKNEPEVLSSHGRTKNQLTLWKYPCMAKMAELRAHTSPVLFMAQSPDGSKVASAAGDKKLFLWDIFVGTDKKKKTLKSRFEVEPSNMYSYIR